MAWGSINSFLCCVQFWTFSTVLLGRCTRMISGVCPVWTCVSMVYGSCHSVFDVHIFIISHFQCGSLLQKGLVRCQSTIDVQHPPDRQDSGLKDSGNKWVLLTVVYVCDRRLGFLGRPALSNLDQSTCTSVSRLGKLSPCWKWPKCLGYCPGYCHGTESHEKAMPCTYAINAKLKFMVGFRT